MTHPGGGEHTAQGFPIPSGLAVGEITHNITFPDDYAEGGWWKRVEDETATGLEEVYLQGDLTPDEQDAYRIEKAAELEVSPQVLGILKHKDGTWVVYQKDKASLVNSQVYKTPAAANAKIAQWMSEGQHTGENRWEM